jgi:protein-L-isoaspartate(D-aspartate) O-methyltransferase
MEIIQKHQRRLSEQSRQTFTKTPISEATEQAFVAMPRHQFIRRYRERGSAEWRRVTDENLGQQLPTLYSNRPLLLSGDDDSILSTISQPSCVLRVIACRLLRPIYWIMA